MKNKNIYGIIAFTAVLCWALWNYDVSLKLLDNFYKVILPFLIGGFIAFIVNVLMTKLEVLWDKVFSQGPLDKLEKVKRIICLLLSIGNNSLAVFSDRFCYSEFIRELNAYVVDN